MSEPRSYSCRATYANGSESTLTTLAYDLNDALAYVRNVYSGAKYFEAKPYALPPVHPPAAEPPTPTEEPADPAVEGRGAACSRLFDQLGRALRRYDYGKLTDADLGIELLRISNELATESKRLRAAQESASLPSAAHTATTFEGSSGADDPPVARSREAAFLAESVTITRPARDHMAEVNPSGGAEALPSGWRDDGRIINHVSGAAVVPRDKARTKCHSFRPVDAQTANIVDEVERPLLQAMCAALGLYGYGGEHPNEHDEANARDALEAFHARQHPALSLETVAKPLARLREQDARDAGCSCYWSVGKRTPSRWCRYGAHASEWQTLAEQRDDRSRGTPELDVRERGLR